MGRSVKISNAKWMEGCRRKTRGEETRTTKGAKLVSSPTCRFVEQQGMISEDQGWWRFKVERACLDFFLGSQDGNCHSAGRSSGYSVIYSALGTWCLPSPCSLPVHVDRSLLFQAVARGGGWFAEESLRSKGRGGEEVGTGDGCNDRSFGQPVQSSNKLIFGAEMSRR